MSRPLPPRAAAPILSTAMWKILVDEELTEEERPEKYFWEVDALPVAWAAWSGEVLSQWTRQNPGCRPSCWWRYSAPEPCRRRLGGIGTIAWERLRAIVPSYHLGIPTQWLTDEDLSVYEKIGRPLNVPALDPRFPPLYEAQPTYLRRLGLLGTTEVRRLSPADFAPLPITEIL